MESVLIAIGALLPMLLVLVAVHEFGHYATAKALGVKALEFGVGLSTPGLWLLHRQHDGRHGLLHAIRQRRRARRPDARPDSDGLFQRGRLREPGRQDHRRRGVQPRRPGRGLYRGWAERARHPQRAAQARRKSQSSGSGRGLAGPGGHALFGELAAPWRVCPAGRGE